MYNFKRNIFMKRKMFTSTENAASVCLSSFPVTPCRMYEIISVWVYLVCYSQLTCSVAESGGGGGGGGKT